MNISYLKPDINSDGSENVKYDNPDFPLYIRKGNLEAYRNFKFSAHRHSDLEFLYVLSGALKYSIDGEIVNLKKGDVIFVSSEHLHFGFSDSKKDARYICALVHPSLFYINPYVEQNYVSPIYYNIFMVNNPYSQ